MPVLSRCQAGIGNPIYPSSGAKRQTEFDYQSANPLLSFARSYDSSTGAFISHFDIDIELPGPFLIRHNQPLYSAIVTSYNGNGGWEYNIPKTFSKLTIDDAAASFTTVDGARVSFTRSGLQWVPNRSDFKDRLASSGSGNSTQWLLSRINEREFLVSDSNGRLLRKQLASGPSVTLSYDATTGYLSAVTDDFGRTVVVANNVDAGGHARLSSIVDPSGSVISYSYNASQQMTGVTYGDLSSKTYVWDEPANSTGSVSAGGKLTGIVDELGTRYATFGYANGRAVSTEHALGTNKFTVIDSRTGLPATGTVNVSYPTGASYTSVYAGVNGQSREISNTQPAGSGCAAATSSRAFDANGNVATSIDLDDHRACYVSDLNSNFPVVRVEGLASSAACNSVTPAHVTLPPGSRKTSTMWHPDWRFEAKVAEPGRITTSVYNGQPDPFNGDAAASCAPSAALLPDGQPIAVLCKRVVQATTDPDGHLAFTAEPQAGVADRVQSWTYNQYGQVRIATDPLEHVTTSTYYTDTAFTGTDPNAVGHTLGDLQTVTNAVGQVTSYDQYDRHGNVLQKTDPNGVATAYAYDLRQRLLSTSVGGQTTSNIYDPVGQLTQVTAPDGSWIGYEYDAAHRQVAVKDSLGNRIEYVLDNAGNKTAENVRDAGGSLKRTLGRSIDALGRVQQTTGRE